MNGPDHLSGRRVKFPSLPCTAAALDPIFFFPTGPLHHFTSERQAPSQPTSPMSASSPPQIYKATYSGVPVYEMQCRDVAVMRRKADRYLNATQILKVAEFDKPQRTRILEREVQKGEHEKIQGG